jgi:hypothetical protein
MSVCRFQPLFLQLGAPAREPLRLLALSRNPVSRKPVTVPRTPHVRLLRADKGVMCYEAARAASGCKWPLNLPTVTLALPRQPLLHFALRNQLL